MGVRSLLVNVRWSFFIIIIILQQLPDQKKKMKRNKSLERFQDIKHHQDL